MENSEFEKSKVFTISEALEYVPHSIVTKIIIRKATGNVSVVAFDSDTIFTGKTTPFDTLIQAIDGKAEIVIDLKASLIEIGQSIIISAHAQYEIKAHGRFKMKSTIIKSGYEDIPV